MSTQGICTGKYVLRFKLRRVFFTLLSIYFITASFTLVKFLSTEFKQGLKFVDMKEENVFSPTQTSWSLRTNNGSVHSNFHKGNNPNDQKNIKLGNEILNVNPKNLTKIQHHLWERRTSSSRNHSLSSQKYHEEMEGFLKHSRGQPPEVRSFLKQQTNYSISATSRIPKVIHKIYISNSGKVPSLSSLPKPQVEALQSWTNMNPAGYEVRYFGLDDCRLYLEKHFHPVFLRAFDCIEANAGKADFFRAAVVYREGGWYSDWKEEVKIEGFLDKLANGKTIDRLFNWNGKVSEGNEAGEQTLIFSWDRSTPHHRDNHCIANAFFGAKPQHPMLAEVLRLILINVQKAHYGPTPQSNVGPCVYGEAYKIFYGSGDYATRLAITKKYPFQSAKYQRNQYTFANSLLPEKTGYLQHKCDGCDSSSMQDEWLGGGNDYRKLYENKQFYCKAASRIFLNVEPSQLKDQIRR